MITSDIFNFVRVLFQTLFIDDLQQLPSHHQKKSSSSIKLN